MLTLIIISNINLKSEKCKYHKFFLFCGGLDKRLYGRILLSLHPLFLKILISNNICNSKYQEIVRELIF